MAAIPLLVRFAGGPRGAWRVTDIAAVRGDGLKPVDRLSVLEGTTPSPPDVEWLLTGVTSNERYITKAEQESLVARQPPLGRPEASAAALIPIRKLPAWWALAQDERRAILEERSHHIAAGLRYLPAVARRLHHSRDLGEPFDFLTWFEYAPQDAAAFEELVGLLRQTAEWSYVEREVDIRLVHEGRVKVP